MAPPATPPDHQASESGESPLPDPTPAPWLDRDRRLPGGPGRTLFSGRSARQRATRAARTLRPMKRRLVGRGRTVTLLVIAVALLGVVAPAGVFAHAELDTMTPADKSTVDIVPAEIVATFTEDLDPAKSSIVVVTAAGAQVASGGEVDPSYAKRMTLALPALEPGGYEVRWTSASAEDGDLDRGVTTFTFAPAATPSPTPSSAASPTAAPTAAPTPPPSPVASASPSGSGQPASTSTTDLLIPIIVAVILVGGFGYWLIRRRSTTSSPP